MSSWQVTHPDGSSESGSIGEGLCTGCGEAILIKYDQEGQPAEEEICTRCRKAGSLRG